MKTELLDEMFNDERQHEIVAAKVTNELYKSLRHQQVAANGKCSVLDRITRSPTAAASAAAAYAGNRSGNVSAAPVIAHPYFLSIYSLAFY